MLLEIRSFQKHAIFFRVSRKEWRGGDPVFYGSSFPLIAQLRRTYASGQCIAYVIGKVHNACNLNPSTSQFCA